MNDTGTTGIQVAPAVPTEDEIMQVRNILQRAVDGLVGMSQLQADVQSLTTEVNALRGDVATYRQTIANQDEMLTHVRGERDTANQVAVANGERARSAEARAFEYAGQLDDLNTKNAKLTDDLNSALQGWGSETTRANLAEQNCKSLTTKLDAIKEGYRNIFGEEPKAVQAAPEAPKPEMLPVSRDPEPTNEGWWNKPNDPAQPVNTTDEWIAGERNPNYVRPF